MLGKFPGDHSRAGQFHLRTFPIGYLQSVTKGPWTIHKVNNFNRCSLKLASRDKVSLICNWCYITKVKACYIKTISFSSFQWTESEWRALVPVVQCHCRTQRSQVRFSGRWTTKVYKPSVEPSGRTYLWRKRQIYGMKYEKSTRRKNSHSPFTQIFVVHNESGMRPLVPLNRLSAAA